MSATSAFGTILRYENPAATFNDIPNIRTFNIPPDMADLIEVTSHSSPDRRKEYLAGLIDSDELTIPFWFVPTNVHHRWLRDNAGAVEAINFQIELTDGTLIDFAAILRGVSIGAPVEGAYDGMITLKRTGANDWTDV